jgi:hypothetical protein
MSELDAYYEQIANRSTTYRAQGVGGNITNTNGDQPGDSTTVAGGQEEIVTSSDLGDNGILTNTFAVVNIPDDPAAFISSDDSQPAPVTPAGRQQALLGNAAQTTQAGSSFGGYDITR